MGGLGSTLENLLTTPQPTTGALLTGQPAPRGLSPLAEAVLAAGLSGMTSSRPMGFTPLGNPIYGGPSTRIGEAGMAGLGTYERAQQLDRLNPAMFRVLANAPLEHAKLGQSEAMTGEAKARTELLGKQGAYYDLVNQMFGGGGTAPSAPSVTTPTAPGVLGAAPGATSGGMPPLPPTPLKDGSILIWGKNGAVTITPEQQQKGLTLTPEELSVLGWTQ